MSGKDLSVIVEVSGRAKKPHVAPNAGEILPELRSKPAVGFLLLSRVLWVSV